MNIKQFGRAVALSLAVATVSMLAGCETQPAFQVSQPSSRVGTVESIRSQTVQNTNATLGTIGGRWSAAFSATRSARVPGGRRRPWLAPRAAPMPAIA